MLNQQTNTTDKDENMQDESQITAMKSITSTDYQSNPSISPQSQAPISDFLSSQSNSANRNLEEIKMNFTPVMLERWHRSNNLLPQIDLKDIVEENPTFNNGKKTCPEHQHHPEFT